VDDLANALGGQGGIVRRNAQAPAEDADLLKGASTAPRWR